MGVNVKIGNDTVNGVNSINLENADSLGAYLNFSLTSKKGSPYELVAIPNVKATFSLYEGE